jgi:hypothetical protein
MSVWPSPSGPSSTRASAAAAGQGLTIDPFSAQMNLIFTGNHWQLSLEGAEVKLLASQSFPFHLNLSCLASVKPLAVFPQRCIS